MPRSPRSRRLGGMTLAGALAVTTVALSAPAASAAGYDGPVQTQTTFSSSDSGTQTGSCSITSGAGGNQSIPFTSNGAPVTVSQSNSATAADSGEPADTTNLAATLQGTAQATEVAGVLKTLDFVATTTLKVEPAQGALTDCNSTAAAVMGTTGTITLPSPRIMVLETKLRGGQLQLQLVRSGAPVTGTVQVEINTNGKSRRVLSLPAGTYSLTLSGGNQLAAPVNVGDPTTATSSLTAHGELFTPGEALGKRIGSGKKYLKLPSSLSCSGSSVTADFTKRAGKKATASNGLNPRIRSARFLVDGEKVKTVSEPHKDTEVKLKNLDVTDEVTVTAVLKLWDKSRVEVSRAYLPCS